MEIAEAVGDRPQKVNLQLFLDFVVTNAQGEQKKLSEDEGSNMNGATTARINSDIFLRLIPMCRLYNIIILVINHITQSGIGSIMPQKSSIAYLKQE